jgi:ABC-type bacteriocin/lantibiotic exporter with double-glycine peptidase domain
MKEDNTVFVLQKVIKAHRLNVTKGSIKEFLISHPRYPSLMSVCDGLKKWNINHYPLKLSKQEILDLEPPFIAHMGRARGQLAFVEKNKDSKVTFFLNQKERIVMSTAEQFLPRRL